MVSVGAQLQAMSRICSCGRHCSWQGAASAAALAAVARRAGAAGHRGSVAGTEQEVVPLGLSEAVESVQGLLVVRGDVSNNDDLVLGLEVLEGVLVDDGYGRHGLLGHV